MGRGIAGMGASPRPAGLLAATVVLVDGGPGAPLCLLLRDPTFFITFGDVIGFACLLVGVF
jgi:hypothetical protein